MVQQQQYTEHETLMDEYASLEKFSPEERLSYAKKRRQEQLKLYDDREAKPELFPPHRASHNKNIKFEINIQIIEAAARDAYEEGITMFINIYQSIKYIGQLSLLDLRKLHHLDWVCS